MKVEVMKARARFWQKKVFLFDLDGTLYLGKRVIPGARELLEKLTSLDKTVFYLTNNSSRSQEDYIEKLRNMGFPCRENQVVMSTHVLITYLKTKNCKSVFLLGTPAMQRMLEEAGIQTQADPQVVVVGFDKTLTYEKLEKACRLVSGGLSYVVTHPDLFCPTEEGPEPDCGAFAQVIELVTKVKPKIVLGKPHPLMLREIQKRGPFKKREMILTGDRLSTDIAMGQNFGLDTLLVLSGETRYRDLSKAQKKNLIISPSVKELL